MKQLFFAIGLLLGTALTLSTAEACDMAEAVYPETTDTPTVEFSL
jgi:hypothetical protein